MGLREGKQLDLGLRRLQRSCTCRGGYRPVSFLPGCPECQLNLLKRQTSRPITLLLAPATHKKTDSEEEQSAGLLCVLSGSVGRLFNLMSTQRLNTRSRVLLKERGRPSAGEQTPLDVVWTHALISNERYGKTHSRK